MRRYFNTHNHTMYSNLRLLDAIIRPSELIDRAIELGLAGLAITDHESLSAHIEAIQHYNNLDEEVRDNFKLALGNEIYLVDELGTGPYRHFILIAKNEKGHRGLRELSSMAWSQSYFSGPMERVPLTKEQLQRVMVNYKGDIIATTACLGGEVGSSILALEKAEQEYRTADAQAHKGNIIEFILLCKEIFGEENFFLEVQPAFSTEQHIMNQRMSNIAGAFGCKIVVGTDSHYLSPADREIHKAYLNSKEGEREVDDFYRTAYLMDWDEIKGYLIQDFSIEQLEEIRLNSLNIAEMIENYDLHKPQAIPKVEVDNYEKRVDFREYEYLSKMVLSDDVQDRYWVNTCVNTLKTKPLLNMRTYLERLDIEAKELWNISERLGEKMTSYYNTMAKIIEITWNEGDSLVGPARGSATGFLSCYLLGITQLDPVVNNLPHWRHLTADRPELPDIDFDTQALRRSKILQAVKDFFGELNVLNIATFGTEGPKSSVITACRGLGIDHDIALYLSGMIPAERGQTWPLKDVLYGNQEKNRRRITEFVQEVNKHSQLEKTMLKIEGIINKRSVHASGVYIFNDGYLEINAMMKAPSGQPITQWAMADSDYMGGLKFDFLTIEALDKIRLCMDTLVKDNFMTWQGTLKSTYDKYIHPDVLNYEDSGMWDMAGNGQIINLFQFDTMVGAQAIKAVKPHSLVDAASANSLMRLMPMEDGTVPVDKYISHKNNIDLWYKEMDMYGLTEEEIKTITPHYLPVFGVPNTQEDLMETLMNPKIANFTLMEANYARKVVAKKKAKEIANLREKVLEKGKESGTSDNLICYIWDTCVGPQLGYSFSRNHTTPYTVIAIQEMNLCLRYPVAYWNCACLSVNAGMDEGSTDYAKMASAIGDIKSRGVNVLYPDINNADFAFKVVGEDIMFGLKGLTNVGDDVVKSIIENRPYSSIIDFTSRLKLGKQQMIALIKAGAFDSIESDKRAVVMVKYIKSIMDTKKRMTMQQYPQVQALDMIPEKLAFENSVFEFNRYLKSVCKNGTYYVFDDRALAFYSSSLDTSLLENVDGQIGIKIKTWDKLYTKTIEPIRTYLTENKDSLLNHLNRSIFFGEWDKYCKGNLSTWEMDALSCYIGEHELAGVDIKRYGITDFAELPEEPEVVDFFLIRGNKIPKFKVDSIIGTVIGKNKSKYVLTLLTLDGVVNIKFRNEQFAFYDKQISEVQEDGTKKVLEKSWFAKGNKLMLTGYRSGDTFKLKTYADSGKRSLYLIEEVAADGQLVLNSVRAGE